MSALCLLSEVVSPVALAVHVARMALAPDYGEDGIVFSYPRDSVATNIDNIIFQLQGILVGHLVSVGKAL